MTAKPRDVPEAAEETVAKPNVIQYHGTGVRTITEADWKSIGIEDGTVEWNRENNYTVLVSELSDKARHHLLFVDGSFSLEHLEF